MNEDKPPDDAARRASIERFAEQLRQLRAQAGNPSFRKMSAESGCISHTTPHEAVTGSRLPSWETTREFVKACGGDAADWRALWEQAHGATTSDQPPPAPCDQDSRSALWPVLRRRISVIIGALLLVATASAVTTALVLSDDSSYESGPLAESAFIEVDRSRFITDGTIPDGTVVETGERFIKVWEIQNAGSVAWRNRYLQRDNLPAEAQECATPDRVPIEDALPNERVEISVAVTARDTPGTCKVKWKMVDEQGRQYFPGLRPVYFEVHVVNSVDDQE